MVLVKGSEPSRFVEGVEDLLGRVSCRLIESAEDREAIYRLRYDAYLREGAIGPDPARRFVDRFDETANERTLGVFVDGRLASSMRLHIGSRECCDIPALTVFSDVLLPMMEAGQTILDPTRFVSDFESAKRYPKLPYVTVRLAWLACEFFDIDLLLATVRSEHQAFYRRLFGHRLVCDARPYPSLRKPISLMMLDHRAERERVLRRYRFFASTRGERAALFGRAKGSPLQEQRPTRQSVAG